MAPAIIEQLRALSGPTALRIDLLQGPLRGSGRELRAIYAGNGSNRAFLSGLLFEEARTTALETFIRPLALAARLERLAGDADVLLSELPRLWAAQLPAGAQLRSPAWMCQVLELKPLVDRWLVPRHLEREVVRQIRRHDYAVRFDATPADLAAFYRELYRSHVEERFGSGAIVVDQPRFMRGARGATLARLYAGGRCVAGVLLKRSGAEVRLGWFGAATDAPRGASEVLDVACIRHACALGARRVHLGNSRPALSDGVVRYKARFGARLLPTRFPQAQLAIVVRRWSDALTRRLDALGLARAHRGRVCVHRLSYAGGSTTVTLAPLDESLDS